MVVDPLADLKAVWNSSSLDSARTPSSIYSLFENCIFRNLHFGSMESAITWKTSLCSRTMPKWGL
jgi:hypothetical protein